MDPDPESSSLLSVAFIQEVLPSLQPDSMGMYIGILVLLWFIAGYLASSIRTLSLLNGSTSEVLDAKGDAASRRLLTLIEEKNQALLTLNGLLVITSVALSVGLYLFFSSFLLPDTLSTTARLISVIALSSLLIIVSNKILPRIVTTQFALVFGTKSSLVTLIIHRIFYLISNPVTRWFKASLGYGTPRMPYLSGDDIKNMADMGEAQGTIEEDEREFIHSIMDFGETTVREIMTSRLDMRALPVDATLQDALELIQSSGHSRLPLYEDDLDHIVGFVYAKDLLPYLTQTDGLLVPDWRSTVRKPFFTREGKMLDDLLRDFQAKNMHIAIVVDEYGGTAGLVTMEDVLEEIVGDIRDEYDEDELKLHEKVDELTHIFDARINLDDFCDLLKIEFDFERYDFETLGGLIFHLKGEVPAEGDHVAYENLSMRVDSVEKHRIGRVHIKIKPPTADKSLVE